MKMKQIGIVLGEIDRDTSIFIGSPLGDENSVIENIKKKFNESPEKIILLFEYGRQDARGYFVKTNTRVIFCLTQNINRFKNTFEIKWVIDDLKNETFDIHLTDENEIKIVDGKFVLFDPNLYSSSRLLKDINNTLFPPKTTITEDIRKEVRIHPKIWNHIAKMYDRYYGDEFVDVLLALPLKRDASKLTRAFLVKFLLSLPLEDSLVVIKDILENDDVKRDKDNNWNIYGDYIKYWREQLINFLKENGIEYEDSSKTFSLVGGEPISIATTKRKLPTLLSIEFNDFFYDSLKDEINKTYKFGLFTSTMFLSRKLLENIVIEILRIKYPPNASGNLELYYGRERFHDFTILLKNLEGKKDEFGIDKDIISEFISSVQPFRPRANSNAHSIIVTSNEDDVLKHDIQKMTALLLKLWNNLRQQNTFFNESMK
jgi:hypothetical protein